MSSDDVYAELERVRRDIATLQHRIPTIENPDWLGPKREQLKAFEAEEQELMQQLAESSHG